LRGESIIADLSVNIGEYHDGEVAGERFLLLPAASALSPRRG
jgi:hypothetical protein